MPNPQAGIDSHLVLRYGDPAGTQTYLPLMLPNPLNSSNFSELPYAQTSYVPFAPQIRQGEASETALTALAVWERFNDLSGGMGHLLESRVQPNFYSYAQGGSSGTTPAIHTAQRGHILPAPQVITVDSARKDIKQFLECAFAGGRELMCLSNATPGIVYSFDSTGTILAAEETLTTTGKQLFFDGTTLFATQGSSNAVRKTTDGDTWSNHTFNADFVCTRENGVLAYVYMNSGVCTFVPGGTESNKTVGVPGTTATNMVAYRGAVFIGKPEGIYRWAAGTFGDAAFFDAQGMVSTDNFTKMVVHNDYLWFNVGNRLFYTNGSQTREHYPADINGYTSIDCVAPTAGPLVIGVHANPRTSGGTLTEQSSLDFINSISDNGLNPIMSIAAQTTSSTASPGTIVDDDSIGTSVWSNPSNAASSNDTYATNIVTADAHSHYIKATNFSFSIPTDATVHGVKVDFEAKATSATVSVPNAKLVKGGVISGDPKTANPQYISTAEVYMSFGSVAHMWGLTLTPTDVNATDFGVAVYVTKNTVNTVSVDHIRITVYYDIGLNDFIGAGATNLYDADKQRLYWCEATTNGLQYADFSTRFRPASFQTQTSVTNAPYLELIEFSAGFSNIKKWAYDAQLTIRNPDSNTFAVIDFSTDGKTTWDRLQDNAGTDLTALALSSKQVGGYFPLNNQWNQLDIRIYLWTTSPNQAAEILKLTIRGLVMVKTLYRFVFPVRADAIVPGIDGDINGPYAMPGNEIRKALITAASQGYPCDLQGLYAREQATAGADWHRGVFQGTPEISPQSFIINSSTQETQVFSVIRLNFVEFVALSGATGTLPAWASG